MEEKSYFDGGLLSLIGWHILGFIITVITLGICYPWACCMIYINVMYACIGIMMQIQD